MIVKVEMVTRPDIVRLTNKDKSIVVSLKAPKKVLNCLAVHPKCFFKVSRVEGSSGFEFHRRVKEETW